MKSTHIAISIEEFELMEHPFGWKAEYFNGRAHLTPRDYLVRTQLTLSPQAIYHRSEWVVPVDRSFQERSIETFLEAFQESVEFCNWSVDDIRIYARKNITGYFQGMRGKPDPVSRIMLEPNSEQVIGLALFVENKAESFQSGLPTMETTQAQEGVELDLLLVKLALFYSYPIRVPNMWMVLSRNSDVFFESKRVSDALNISIHKLYK